MTTKLNILTAELELAVVDAALARYGNPLNPCTGAEAEAKLIAAVTALQTARKEKQPQTLWGLPVVVVPEGTIPAEPGWVIADWTDFPRIINSNDFIAGIYQLMDGNIQIVMTEEETDKKFRVKIELVPVDEIKS